MSVHQVWSALSLRSFQSRTISQISQDARSQHSDWLSNALHRGTQRCPDRLLERVLQEQSATVEAVQSVQLWERRQSTPKSQGAAAGQVLLM